MRQGTKVKAAVDITYDMMFNTGQEIVIVKKGTEGKVIKYHKEIDAIRVDFPDTTDWYYDSSWIEKA